MLKKLICGRTDQGGIALIMVLGVLAVLLILAVTFAFNMRVEQQAARNYLDYVSADFYAKAGAHHAVAALRNPHQDIWDDRLELGEEIEFVGPNFTYRIIPQSGRLNLNFTGNLQGAGDTHNVEDSWTTFETSIADVLYALLSGIGITQAEAEGMAGDIIRRRYRGLNQAGDSDDTYDEALREGTSGIDHDASGVSVSNTDPSWFVEWDGRGEHEPFDAENLEAELEALGWPDFEDIWEILEEHVTAGTRSSGELGLLNLNAVESARRLFNRMGLSAGTFAQKAVNIIDFRDRNHHISSLTLAQTYYGVESVLINEVLANSYYEETEPGETYYEIEVAPDTTFLTGFRVLGEAGETVTVRVEGDVVELYEGDLPWTEDSLLITSSAGGMLSFEITEGPGEFDMIILECPEFIELINIGEEDVSLDGWSVQIDDGAPLAVQGAPVIGPGEYIILTNEAGFFIALNPDVDAASVFEVDDWGELPDDGDFDLRLFVEYNDPDDYLLADIAVAPGGGVNVFGSDVANTQRPGSSDRIGNSREKSDPTDRTSWADSSASTPGEPNSVVADPGDIAALSVRNNYFRNVTEVMEVASGEGGTISESMMQGIARECSAYYIRLDAERADSPPDAPPAGWDRDVPPGYDTEMDRAVGSGQDGTWIWEEIRLNPEIEYGLYIYGMYRPGDPGEDFEITLLNDDPFIVEYSESDGAYVTRIGEDHIGPDYSFRIQLESRKDDVYFDYLMLIPDGVHGKINVNAASREVLMGLPGIGLAEADSIRANRPYDNVGELLRALAPEEFAGVANLASVTGRGASDTYRIISTGFHLSPAGAETSRRKIEMLVRLSAGDVSVISWKYVYD